VDPTEISRKTVWQKAERRLAIWSPGNRVKLNIGTSIVSFTFDDVAQSACREGRDILENQDCRGTYYVSGGFTGLQSQNEAFHTHADLVGLRDAGQELACHGFAHKNYQTLSEAMIRSDIAQNRIFFERLGCDVSASNFAYPFGCVSPFAKRLVSSEFISARGGRNRPNRRYADLALLCSMPLYEKFWTHASLARLLDAMVERAGWLIFVSHGVMNEPDEFGCTPSLLKFAVSYATSARLRVLPVRDALDCISSGSVRRQGSQAYTSRDQDLVAARTHLGSP
jgi:peptidoglycan/xylan/chitin deacetylase (PgdA/CDA1 family)